MSNIYLKVTTTTLFTQNFDFLSLKSSKFKKLVYRSVFRELEFLQVSLKFKTFCCYLNQRPGSKSLCSFSIIFILKGIMTLESQRVHAFC